ncbi:MAG: amidohydrolase [Gemmatimonadota bacterium]|nr:MAG: amidohydrolase [Gemmatimonadota bacterium]
MHNLKRFTLATLIIANSAWITGCEMVRTADLMLINGKVYTLDWDDPAIDGTPAANAPHDATGWHPDAEAVAVRGREIIFVGTTADAAKFRGPSTEVIDLNGATVVPGLIDSHVHIQGLGANLERVNLMGIETEEEAVELVAQRAREVPPGEWVIGWGWDEGAWANRYPTMALLSERVPDHPVYLSGLHGFAVWGNRLAFARAGITAATESPSGGEIVKDRRGTPTGVLINNATALLESAIPQLTAEQTQNQVLAGLEAMAASGYVAVHEAGAGRSLMQTFEALDTDNRLPIRVYVMIRAEDEALCREWLDTGPEAIGDRMLTTRAVKAFYDGALGSRGARLLEDYSDQPGHRGVSGSEYGFDETLVEEMIRAGFQVSIHAIGDAGNRETLDFFQRVAATDPDSRQLRHRIAHAQVLDPADVGRIAELEIIASMQPPHAVEDKTWAEDRLGPDRVRFAYAWRSLRESGAQLVFNSDLAGSDHDIFYGLHAAITRRDKQQLPEGGWYPAQSMTPEEALRGYTSWGAFSAFAEDVTGVLAPGRWADITVMDIDPLAVGDSRPGNLLNGSILLTLVGGEIVFRKEGEAGE